MGVLKNFFVVEGADGVGKSSALEELRCLCAQRGKKASFTAEPTVELMGVVAKLLQQYEIKLNSDMMSYIFAADRHDHLYKKGGIIDMACEGAVFCDRYRVSSTVYQGFMGTAPYINGPSSEKLIWELNRMFPCPEAMFLLDAPSDVVVERLEQRDGKADRKETELLLNYYRSHFTYLDDVAPRRMHIVYVDATKPARDIAEIIYSEAFGEGSS